MSTFALQFRNIDCEIPLGRMYTTLLHDAWIHLRFPFFLLHVSLPDKSQPPDTSRKAFSEPTTNTSPRNVPLVRASVVLSDMAPSFSGDRDTDQARVAGLLLNAFQACVGDESRCGFDVQRYSCFSVREGVAISQYMDAML